MAEPTIQQIFGAGATQTAGAITIQKADLAGLTPAADNRGEQLLVAVLLKAKSFLTTVNQEANPEQSVTLEDSFDSITLRNNASYRQKTISINLQKLDVDTGVDPDDF